MREKNADKLVNLLRSRSMTVCCAESCTGGLIADAIVSIPGASAVFAGGIVSYSEKAKEEVLGVSHATLAECGAVSRACAEEMARCAKEKFHTNVAISSTGTAGPGPGPHGEECGGVYIGVATDEGVSSEYVVFGGDRSDVRRGAVAYALSLVLTKLY